MFGNQQDTVLVGWKKAVVTTDAKSCRGRIKSVGEVCHDKKTVFGVIPIFRKCDATCLGPQALNPALRHWQSSLGDL